MKKFGFTLAELLVSLTVIAIAATMMASLSGNLMPDKNKVKVLKFHSAISNALESMFNNENLYHPGQRIEGNQVVASCEGVECFGNFDDFQNLLIARVPQSFMGGTWDIAENENHTGYIITLDIDPNNATQTSYTTEVDVRDIDSFVLNLDKYGELTPGDNLTRAYLENPLNLKSRKEDLAKAESLANAEENDNDGLSSSVVVERNTEAVDKTKSETQTNTNTNTNTNFNTSTTTKTSTKTNTSTR